MKRDCINKIANSFAWVFVAILLITSSGCSRSQTAGAAVFEPIKIGWIGPLSGDAAIIGVPNKEGVEVAVDKINANGGIDGRPIKIIFEDDQMEPTKTQNSYRKLVNVDGVKAILAVSYGGLLGLADQSQQDGIVIMNALDVSEELAAAGDNVFAVGVYDEEIGRTLGGFIPATENVAIAYDNAEPFMALVKDNLISKFKGNITAILSYDPKDHDARTLMLKAKNSGATTIVLLGYDETGLMARQAKQLGIDIHIAGVDTFTSENWRKNAQGAEEGAYFTYWGMPDSPEAKQFTQAYTRPNSAKISRTHSTQPLDTMPCLWLPRR